MEPALAAIYRALETRLNNTGEPWSGAYADNVPAGKPRPYIVYFLSGGGEVNRNRTQDAEVVMTVKALANSLSTAFECAARLSELLNDSGTQDSADPLEGGSDWEILTVSQERAIHLIETSDGKRIYHEGFQLRVVMEAK